LCPSKCFVSGEVVSFVMAEVRLASDLVLDLPLVMIEVLDDPATLDTKIVD
jgi:hypothetical protein